MKTFSITNIGRRREMNQDYMFTSETAVGKLPNLFVVADGMGGHKAGEYASKFTVETLVKSVRESEIGEPVAVVKAALTKANSLLMRESQADMSKNGMGTTVVVATIIDHVLYAANVGDSRLYVVNKDQITQITRDHSLVEEMVRLGEMDKAEAKDHPDKNIITRAIGVASDLAIDFFEMEIKSGDIVLMCSDGLTNMIDDENIKKIVLGQRDIVEIAEKLVDTANENGGKDNITVVLIEPFSEDMIEV